MLLSLTFALCTRFSTSRLYGTAALHGFGRTAVRSRKPEAHQHKTSCRNRNSYIRCMHRHSGWRRCVIIGPNSTAITTPDRLTHSTVMTSMRYDSQFKEVRQSFNSACFCLAPRTASFSTLDACSPLETPLLEVLSAAQYYVVLHIYVEIPTALPTDSIAG